MPRGVYARPNGKPKEKVKVSKEIFILCNKVRKELDKSPGITDLKIYTHLLLKELGNE